MRANVFKTISKPSVVGLLSKKLLKKEFAKDWKKHYEIELFKEKDFLRKTCALCGKNFWTLDENRESCADPPCQNYDFINNTITKKKFDYIEMWRIFENFFKKEGHTFVPRYPVVDRWRPDLYFTMASIQDFQRLEKGNMSFEYPANPLVVPQVCLRFNDIPNVGVTGRHLTSFVMAGQHAFGYPETGYFKDRCIDLNFKFLTKEMGIPEKELVYAEDVWAMNDFSAFGPSMETFSRGLELVNSVFMQFQSSDGVSRKELDLKVIDVGWGLERLVWFSNGTPASYDSLFGPVTPKMKARSNIEINDEAFDKYSVIAGNLNLDEVSDMDKARRDVASHVGLTVDEMSRMVEPLQAMYAIADHARTLLFAIADGGIPSNVGGGYNLRILLRRALNYISKYDFDFTMGDIAAWHADYLKPMFPELNEGIDNVSKILSVEEKKHFQTREKSRRMIISMFAKSVKFNDVVLAELYESHGITPGLIETVGLESGKEFHIPGDFYVKLAARHEKEIKKEKKTSFDLIGLPPTFKLFYETDKLDFDAVVVDVKDSWVVLDRTAFYATGGGQDHDTGTLDGVEVVDVIKVDNIILHNVKDSSKFKKGVRVKGAVDALRRKLLTQMHTGTHVLGAAARIVLGPHIWQAGAAKTVEKSRLDITHYDNLTDDEFKKIEEIANELIAQKIKVDITELPRGEAEKKYGFIIYQGGGSPGKFVRIIKISDVDVQACGGTHVKNTGDIERIKIIGTRKIQDGAIRLEFVAGSLTEEKDKDKEKTLTDALKTLGVDDIGLAPAYARALFKNWKELKKIHGPLMFFKREKNTVGIKCIKENLAGFTEVLPLKETRAYDTETVIKELSTILKVQEEHIPKTIKRFKDEIAKFRDDIDMA
ncbi:MAG: alanine--tRNA ligase [Candidatus Aenigmarchaeota archaeon]|nr:alanine--tRNA ligase [Candidatus Aenigmarchaeota archaeon]